MHQIFLSYLISPSYATKFQNIFKNSQLLLGKGYGLKAVLTKDMFKVHPSQKSHLEIPPSDHVYLGNLPSTWNHEDVMNLVYPIFEEERPHSITMKQPSPNSRTHCFIWAKTVRLAQQCIATLNGYLIPGTKLEIRVRIK